MEIVFRNLPCGALEKTFFKKAFVYVLSYLPLGQDHKKCSEIGHHKQHKF